MEQTKYFIFLDNSGSMSSYYNNVKTNLEQLSDLDLTNRNLTFLTFDSDTTELSGTTFKDKLVNYKRPGGMTELEGVASRFRNYVFSAPVGQKICILFVTDGDVQDLHNITPILVDCAYTIAAKKLSVYMSCVAINSSADMKAFSLLGLLNNFSVFQLVQSKNGDGWGTQVLEKLKEVRDCETCVYTTESADYIYSGVTVDSRISEKGAFNKVFLATLVQAFTICKFTPDRRAGLTLRQSELDRSPGNVKGFFLCKRLLKYVMDLGVNAKTRYIWSKLKTAKMVGEQDSNAIANEFMATIADSVKTTNIASHVHDNIVSRGHDNSCSEDIDTTHNNVSITNEHNVRIRFFVGPVKSFTNCLPITIHNNQVVVQSGSSSELYLNIEVYHPEEPVYIEVAYADSKHTWFVPYGVSLIEGDTNYLMLAHEKLDLPNNVNKEQMFDFLVKAVPASLTSAIKQAPATIFTDSIEDTDSIDDTDSFEDTDSIDDTDSIKDMALFNQRFRQRCAASNSSMASSKSRRTDTVSEHDTTSSMVCERDNEPHMFFASRVPSRCAKAFPTVSQETRRIDTVKRTRQINSDVHVLCFTFGFVCESDPDSWKAVLIKIPLSEVIFITKECVICMENESAIKLSCNHKCMCETCHSFYIQQFKKCPMCRALISS